MRLAWNLAAAMANSVAVVLINLAALPFYLHFLGIEAYGLIGFFVTLQAVLQLFDLGLSATMNREVARGAATAQLRRSASLLRTLGLVYLGMALLIAGLLALAAPWIAAHWLNASTLPHETIVQSITLMGITIACRWPIGLYHGALAGSHRLARSALTSLTVSASSAAVTIAALAWCDTSIQTFFFAQASFGLLHALTLRFLARQAVGERDAPFDFRGLQRVWAYSAWMGGVAVAGLLLSQVDKIVLSRTLELEEFGHYMLATLLASGLNMLTLPVHAALFPKFSTLIARGDWTSLEYLYGVATRLLAIALFALASLLMFQSGPLLLVWLRDAALAEAVAPIAALLGLGAALNGIMYLPYTLQLAAGRSKLAFSIAIVLLAGMLPLAVLLATAYGPLGGAMAWLAIGGSYAVLGTWLTGRAVTDFAGWRWLTGQVAIPALATVLPGLLGAWICRTLGAGPWTALSIGGVAALAGVGLGLMTTFSLRELRGLADMAMGRPQLS